MPEIREQSPIHIRLLIETIILVSLCLLIVFSIALAGSDKGAEKMDLPGGSWGKVPFPHLLHQEKLGDCNICHSLFPQVSGAIEDMKAQGKLEAKYVMKKHCTKCHKKERLAGNPHGPTTCGKCHVK